jgi:hypothetical protein
MTGCGNQRKNAKCIDYDYKVGDKVLLIKKVSSAKQSPHMAKSHGLLLQLIRMELSGFNTESEQNNLVSKEYNHLQIIVYKLGKTYIRTISSIPLSPTLTKSYASLIVTLFLHLQ